MINFDNYARPLCCRRTPDAAASTPKIALQALLFVAYRTFRSPHKAVQKELKCRSSRYRWILPLLSEMGAAEAWKGDQVCMLTSHFRTSAHEIPVSAHEFPVCAHENPVCAHKIPARTVWDERCSRTHTTFRSALTSFRLRLASWS